MDLEKTVELAEKISALLEKHAGDAWPGFRPYPFVLYDKIAQVAVGEGFPARFSKLRGNIWTATGEEPDFFGNTSIEYNGQLTAIWDVTTWAFDAKISAHASCIGHEMFHCFQSGFAKKNVGNIMQAATYPHSALSILLTIKENKLLAEAIECNDKQRVASCARQIAALRRQRAKLLQEHMGVDDLDETYEGTAAYVEIRLAAAIDGTGPQLALKKYVDFLHDYGNLPDKYRHRCYASGLALCLIADMLCPNWHEEWARSPLPIFGMIASIPGLDDASGEYEPTAAEIDEAEAIAQKSSDDKTRKFSDFLRQPTVSFDKEISQGMLDPMNIVVMDGRCLHERGGEVTISGKRHALNFPYMTEFGQHLWDVCRIIVPRDNPLGLT